MGVVHLYAQIIHRIHYVLSGTATSLFVKISQVMEINVLGTQEEALLVLEVEDHLHLAVVLPGIQTNQCARITPTGVETAHGIREVLFVTMEHPYHVHLMVLNPFVKTIILMGVSVVGVLEVILVRVR